MILKDFIRDKLFYNEFQPLWSNLSKSIFAYEALLRTPTKMNPTELFNYARSRNLLYDLDIAAILNAVKEYPLKFLNEFYLFINIFPSTIVHKDFNSFLEKMIAVYPHIKGRVVFEINEDPIEENIWEQSSFKARLQLLKNEGFKLAFDDIKNIESSLCKINNFCPHFVKLDRTFIKKLYLKEDQSGISFLQGDESVDIDLVIEGIETESDLLRAINMGIPIIQGYYISKPHRL
ncbi:EAL domain-containing protein [Bacillus sp. CGMCC 1.16607]|uniref:EAL domain-containing protein n=1 Tax=Bacillus sp. CGMCC 1.16607 TaxID=3351842 RepID=UPI00362D2069